MLWVRGLDLTVHKGVIDYLFIGRGAASCLDLFVRTGYDMVWCHRVVVPVVRFVPGMDGIVVVEASSLPYS